MDIFNVNVVVGLLNKNVVQIYNFNATTIMLVPISKSVINLCISINVNISTHARTKIMINSIQYIAIGQYSIIVELLLLNNGNFWPKKMYIKPLFG